jgi:hypothetical protein
MSTESKEAEPAMDMVVDEIVEDEYVNSFESIETAIDQTSRIADYELLLQNPRFDDKAVKIKEQCIYRYSIH